MGNHFHLFLEVPDKEAALKGWKDEAYIKQLEVLRKEWSSHQLLGDLAMYQESGHADGVREIVDQVKGRMFDLSKFMKELKLKMTLAYNRKHGRAGALWEGRFKSVLLESGDGGDGGDGLY